MKYVIDDKVLNDKIKDKVMLLDYLRDGDNQEEFVEQMFTFFDIGTLENFMVNKITMERLTKLWGLECK